MNPSSKRPPREVFLEAVEIEDPGRRSAYLDDACAGNPELRWRVEKLLALEAKAGGPPAESPSSNPISNDPASGSRISHYKLLEQIGEGGCGAVYMAEQEKPVRRKVALKIIKLGMDTKQVVARFEAERQALAMMEHPNIARVLDAGATDAGRPYFVMELVRGIKITDYCDENQLSTRERLDLFMQVCHAVQHAHQKGIIHRDLKPSNVLVTEADGKPVPKVIDFGIAKAVEGRLTDNTLFTAFEQLIGTPSYMSPEQASLVTSDIDTRTDIYSLGVMLYQLLTGETPFDTKALLAAGLDEMRRAISERVPERPSTRLTTMAPDQIKAVARARGSDPSRFAHLLAGDLDWIVMKCLEKDRARRYETANGLAMDVQRHLNNEPIVARPPSRLYEFQKTVRRHWVGFTATAAVILTLAAGLSGVLWQWNRATANGRLAVANEWRARQNAYAADMKLAQQTLEDGDLGTTLSLLNKYRPEQNSRDLRGWEWRYLWSLCRSDELSRLIYPSWVGSVSVSPEWNTLAIQRGDGQITLLDLSSHEEFTNLQASGFQRTVVFSPTGTLLAAANAEAGKVPEVILWDLRDLSRKVSLPHDAPVMSLAFSPDGSLLATKDSLEVFRVWDVESGALRTDDVIPASGRGFHDASPGVLRFSHEGSRLIFQQGETSLRVVNWETNEETPVGRPPSELLRNDRSLLRITSIAVSPSGLLAWGVGAGAIYLWDMDQGASAGELIGHGGSVLALKFTPDGKRLISAGSDQIIRIWDLAEQSEVSSLRGHEDEVWALDILPDGKTLVSGSTDGSVRFWNLSTLNESAPSHRVLPLIKARFTQDGERLLGLDPAVESLSVWDTRSLEKIRTLSELGTGNYTFNLSRNEKWLVVAPRDETSVRIWDWRARQIITNLALPARPEGIGFLPGDEMVWARYFLNDGSSRIIGTTPIWKLWKTGSWEEIMVDWVKPYSLAAAVSPDGHSVAIGYETGEIELRNFPDGRIIRAWEGYSSEAGHLQFSPDGRMLASGSRNGFVKVWDVQTQKELMEFRGRYNQGGGTFSPDSRRLAVGSAGDGVVGPYVSLWDLATQRELLTLRGASSRARFSPNGNLILAMETPLVGDWRLHVWRAPSWKEIETAERATRSNALP